MLALTGNGLAVIAMKVTLVHDVSHVRMAIMEDQKFKVKTAYFLIDKLVPKHCHQVTTANHASVPETSIQTSPVRVTQLQENA